MYDDFHSTSLLALPLVKFYRKKARLTLQYETAVTDATFLKRYGFLSIETFSQVLREVAEKFHLIDTRLKKSDDFDSSRFHRDISALIAAAPKCDDDLRKMKELLDTKDKERRAAMDPWDRLGLSFIHNFEGLRKKGSGVSFAVKIVNDEKSSPRNRLPTPFALLA